MTSTGKKNCFYFSVAMLWDRNLHVIFLGKYQKEESESEDRGKGHEKKIVYCCLVMA